MADEASRPVVLSLTGITKRFGGKLANDSITLDLRAGEILGLLGENGAGKTTLISILFGHYVPDSGAIEIFGRRLPPGQPRAAIDAGIGLVHQHFTLASNLTVLDNVLAGTEPLWRLRSARKAARERLRNLSMQFGLSVDPDSRVGRLSVGEQQRVEILKSLYRDARILVLDEPTAVLTPAESQRLFETLGKMAATGLSVILISHKLDEVLRACERVAVLRGGRLVAQRPSATVDRAMLAELMVGRRVTRPTREPLPRGEPVLGLSRAGLRGDDGRWLKDAELIVHAREIVGVVGVAGNGQRALLQLAFGLAVPSSGRLTVCGRVVDRKVSHRELRAAGVARIPEDRHHEGVVGDLPIWQNAVLEDLGDRRFARFGWIRRGAAIAHARRLIGAYGIRCEGPAQRTRLLSGGNMQKLVIARGLDIVPRLIVASQPTRGLDEGAIAEVHARLLASREQGAGVLLVTEDLEEALALSDRLVIVRDGHVSMPIPAPDFDIGRIGLLMLGQEESARAA